MPIRKDDPNNSLKIDAIFVYNDPRDWAVDTQLILDLLLSKQGILGTYSEKNGDKSLPNNGWQQDGQPPIFFSNPDLFWGKFISSVTEHLRVIANTQKLLHIISTV